MRTWVEIDLAAMRANAEMFRARIGGAGLIAVVKADAYGHGSERVAQALEPLVERFAVASVDEATALRDAGIKRPILLLYPILPEMIDAGLDAQVDFTVGGLDEVNCLQARAAAARRTASVHVKINTGMNRYGADPYEAAELVTACQRSSAIRLVGVFTHFARSDEPNEPLTSEQFKTFSKVVRDLNLESVTLHAANTAAAMFFPETTLDAARIGLGLYGVMPSLGVESPMALRPAMTWKARVNRAHTLRMGEGVSYGHRFVAPRSMTVAAVTVGYADGYLHSASNAAYALIRGKRAPIVGNVCMDALVCDVSQIPGVVYGDDVTLVGTDGDEAIRVEDVARWCGTIPYEVLVRIGARVARVYLPDVTNE